MQIKAQGSTTPPVSIRHGVRIIKEIERVDSTRLTGPGMMMYVELLSVELGEQATVKAETLAPALISDQGVSAGSLYLLTPNALRIVVSM
ncbi:MAG: hypothetical protein QW205_01295 [Desulfurococcaceae archaeon]